MGKMVNKKLNACIIINSRFSSVIDIRTYVIELATCAIMHRSYLSPKPSVEITA